MEDKNKKDENNIIYFIQNDSTYFIIIRQLKNNILEKIEEEYKESTKSKTLVFDFWNINDFLETKDNELIKNIIKRIKPNSLVIKHCPIKEEFYFYKDGEDLLELDGLYITDELYTMSPCLNELFKYIKTKKLQLKKIKINSKDQLNNFLDFIIKTQCEELILDDIFIELLIKEKENDEENDTLEQYFSLDINKGKINIIKKNDIIITKIKKLKLVDCPLFCFPDDETNDYYEKDTLKKISQFKDISFDIDENSLLNPKMITKFKMDKGLFDICYDLDSFKLNFNSNDVDENGKKYYLKFLKYIFELIKDNNSIYRKIKFKNFDTTKLEYIIGYNTQKFDEGNLILNTNETTLKKNFEENVKEIKDKIRNIKLINIKELIFDNCTNYFIEMILSMINKENLIDLLKIKKCANEYFIFNNLYSLKINHLYLFDIPIYYKPEDIEKQKVKDGQLTLKIVSLEHYCKENDLNFYKVMENIRQLLKETERKTICFEMNALPNLINFLLAEQYNEKKNVDEKEIQQYFPSKKDEELKMERDKYFDKIEKIENLKDKKIILKRNNIRNRLENFFYIMQLNNFKILEKEDKHRKEVSDHGKEMAYLDIDYKKFFIKNEIKEITIENCLFTDLDKIYFKSEQLKKKIEKENKSTILNFLEENTKYKIDMKTLKEILLKNNKIDDFAHLMKKSFQDFKYLLSPRDLFTELNNRIIIVINSIQEYKELYCLLFILYKKNKLFEDLRAEREKEKKELEEKAKKEAENANRKKNDKENNKENNEEKDKKEEKKEKKIKIEEDETVKELREYFIKEKSYEEGEKITHTIFNYYNQNDNEKKIFSFLENSGYKIIINFEGKKLEDLWNVIYE